MVKPRQQALLALIVVLSLLWTACRLPMPAAQNGNPVELPGPTALPTDTQAPTASPAIPRRTIDLKNLPIGDMRVATQPKSGYIWACNTNFNGGGAFASGSWIHSDGTFDLTAKPTVDGRVDWPRSFNITLRGDQRVFTGNDLPDHPTGTFPVSRGDDAYQYDRNPNTISAQTVRFELPANPAPAASPGCVGGMVGILLSGAYLFNAFDAGGKDAVAHEIQDDCQGHPQQSGVYHYHNLSNCVADEGMGHSALLGYVLDGFGIFGHHGENGDILTNADLNECHGHTHEIEWDGQRVATYHYHATYEFPYTVGCYQGAALDLRNIPGNGQPPQQAVDACVVRAENAACSMTILNGQVSGICTLVQQLACVPPGGEPPGPE